MNCLPKQVSTDQKQSQKESVQRGIETWLNQRTQNAEHEWQAVALFNRF